MNKDKLKKTLSLIKNGSGTLQERINLFQKQWNYTDHLYLWSRLKDKFPNKDIDAALLIELKQRFEGEKDLVQINIFFENLFNGYETSYKYLDSLCKGLILGEASIIQLVNWHKKICRGLNGRKEYMPRSIETVLYTKLNLFYSDKNKEEDSYEILTAINCYPLPDYFFEVFKDKHEKLFGPISKSCKKNQLLSDKELRDFITEKIYRATNVSELNSIKNLNSIVQEKFSKHFETKERSLIRETSNSLEILDLIQQIGRDGKNYPEANSKFYYLIQKDFAENKGRNHYAKLKEYIFFGSDFIEEMFEKFLEESFMEDLKKIKSPTERIKFILEYQYFYSNYNKDKSQEYLAKELDKIKISEISTELLSILNRYTSECSSFEETIEAYFKRLESRV
ncbi:hypothetical protein HOD29_02825 [archaeon]|jgi:hypothetical protein|nr:hypothetical protein [archaeon]